MVGVKRIVLDIIFPFGDLAFPVRLVRRRRRSICSGSRKPDDCLPVDFGACECRAIGHRTVSPPLTQRHHHRLRSHKHPYHQRQVFGCEDGDKSCEGEAGSVGMRQPETVTGWQVKDPRQHKNTGLPEVVVVTQ